METKYQDSRVHVPVDSRSRPTITIGKVITAPAGSEAKVINRGTNTDLVLDFVIPRGDVGQGLVGPQGPAGSVGIGQRGEPGYVTIHLEQSGDNEVLVKVDGDKTVSTLKSIPGCQGVAGKDSVVPTSWPRWCQSNNHNWFS